MERFKYYLSFILWPGLFAGCMAITWYGFSREAPLSVGGFELDQTLLYFNFAYIFMIIALWRLEIWMPHEREWHKPDGQNLASILHTLSSKGTVQTLILYSSVIGLADYMDGTGGLGLWPMDWPLWGQVCLGVFAAEFALYWAHRWGHENDTIWQFHSVHHSVKKLWFLNTGRFHFVDSLISIVLGMAVLLILGAPMVIVMWLSAVTAFIGMLTHCNVEMRTGWLNYIFNTPGLHRWHHSLVYREGNRNYGENIVFWDQVFGTYFDADRRPTSNIGITSHMPDAFWKQVLWPFLPPSLRLKIEPGYKHKPFFHMKLKPTRFKVKKASR